MGIGEFVFFWEEVGILWFYLLVKWVTIVEKINSEGKVWKRVKELYTFSQIFP